MRLLRPVSTGVVVTVTLLLALLAGGAILYWLFYLALFTMVLPPFFTWRKLHKLEIEAAFTDSSAQVGDTVDLKIRIHNAGHGHLPLVSVKTSLGNLPDSSDELLLTIEAGETYILRKSISCWRRGVYQVKHFEITTVDPWELVQFSRSPRGEFGVTVYPRMRQIHELPIDASQFYGSLAAALPVFEDPSRLNDLRQWRPGDSPKRIHWRATAKSDQLVVKSYELRADSRVVLLLDMCHSSYVSDSGSLLEDAAVEAALAVLNSCLQLEIPVDLVVNSGELLHLTFTHATDLEIAMDHFVRLKADGQLPPHEVIAAAAASRTHRGAMIVITPLLTEHIARSLLLAGEKLRPVLFQVSSAETTTQQQQLISRLEREHIAAFTIPAPEVAYGQSQFLPLTRWKGELK